MRGRRKVKDADQLPDSPLFSLILSICRQCYAVSDDAPRAVARYAELLAMATANEIRKEFDEDESVDAAADYILTKKKVMI